MKEKLGGYKERNTGEVFIKDRWKEEIGKREEIYERMNWWDNEIRRWRSITSKSSKEAKLHY